jgi:hypothetical protein
MRSQCDATYAAPISLRRINRAVERRVNVNVEAQWRLLKARDLLDLDVEENAEGEGWKDTRACS